MACRRSYYPPIAKPHYTLPFYNSPTAGAYRLKGGSLRGEFVRHVPECYLAWNALVYNEASYTHPEHTSLASNASKRNKASPYPGPTYTVALKWRDGTGMTTPEDISCLSDAMKDSRFDAYLLWTRGDLSDQCRASPVGRTYFKALEVYMRGLEGYFGNEFPIEAYETMLGVSGITQVLFVSKGFKGIDGPGQMTFTYSDLEHANSNNRDIRMTALTMALFDKVNAVRDVNFAWQWY